VIRAETLFDVGRELDTRRYRLRDRVMFLLSLKSGLRAKEVAGVT
jgi:hypothetical protein